MSKYRILVVEDDAINRKAISAIFRLAPEFELVFEENGDEVVRLSTGGTISAVLMDVSLSDTTLRGSAVDGVQLTRAIRSEPKGIEVPVLLVTANAMAGDRERLLAASGADGYVSKPIEDIDGFLDLVRGLARTSRPVEV